MAYTRKDFGLELKEKIKKGEAQDAIGEWAYAMYYEHMLEIDDDFQDFLTDLNAMEGGPEFARSYEELDQIADRLIAGENVKLYP
ncbi:MAG: hypothetical protein NTZ68_04425 [Candidatus Dependentiae bacterium]|nr:hypothetical protein [Candidatus Dependentiae bacterium]